jgi:cysteine desulfurase
MGGHQEKGIRAGTENIPYIVALGKAVILADKNMERYQSEVGDLRDQLEGFIESEIPDVVINGKDVFRLDNTISVSFKGIEGESIVYALNEYGICVSTGSACSSGDLSLSRVITALNLPAEYSHGTIRISLGLYNTRDDVEKIKRVLPEVIKVLRKISPFYE